MPDLRDGVMRHHHASGASIVGIVVASGSVRPNFFPPTREIPAKEFASTHYFGKTYFG
jgi:hypothetical protein